tara:strand:+ start:335 stop:1084 length:750 start_codon:yes stop_codon:yes gene_type:complete
MNTGDIRKVFTDACLELTSVGCHSDNDKVCPNYLSTERSSRCTDFLKYTYPDKFANVPYSDPVETPELLKRLGMGETDAQRNGARRYFDGEKHTICKKPENINYEFCSCLARTTEDSIWYKGGGDTIGYGEIVDTLSSNGVPMQDDQCWYKNCHEPAQAGYLQATPKIMTTTDLMKTDQCKGPNCVHVVSNFGPGAIDIGKYSSACNISDGGGGTTPVPNAPPSRNLILILAAVLVPLVLLVLLFRRGQ